jgi:hypothetical protein
MSIANPQLFAPLLAWLEAKAPHAILPCDFNMGYFSHQLQNSCRTAVCMAGALAQFHGLDIVATGHISQIREVAKFLDLSPSQSADLFYAGSSSTYGGEFIDYTPMTYITPAGAAHALRTFLATGKCDWSQYNV